MDKLREKMHSAVMGMVIRKGINEITDDCVKIANDYSNSQSIEFAEWMHEETEYVGSMKYRMVSEVNSLYYTLQDLLQKFKER